MLRRAALIVVVLAVAVVFGVYSLGKGWFGSHEGPGRIAGRRVPKETVQKRAVAQVNAASRLGAPTDKQILFGDLHVHTTFSPDAYFMSLPLLQGEGAHPPADACDFARYCSALDFWSINDHSEGITPEHWRETVESIRQCNEVAGDGESPDTVAFLGWEWTQVGLTPATHYGHKNVVLRGTADDEIPTRPISSKGLTAEALRGGLGLTQRALMVLAGGEGRYLDLMRYLDERESADRCPDGVPVRELPTDCMESVTTPGELFAKLDEWGHPAIVIPHGTTWGFYTPAGSTWDKQLSAAQHDPDRQTLFEVFSGHGNSEEYRDWHAVRYDESGQPTCPPPTPSYLPSCWRAGQIIFERCTKAGLDAKVCDQRAALTRQRYVEGGNAGHHAVPGVTLEDWLDAGQCRDCFLPSFNYRPGGSAQYVMALRNFSEPEGPHRFRFGFIASSDNHTARPGTGYKETHRREMTEADGPNDEIWRDRLRVASSEPEPESRSAADLAEELQPFQLLELERQASFFMTGGLVAVHADGRDRDAIWEALQRREVYGTSGERILLWFDLLNAPDGQGGEKGLAMGGETAMSTAPRFRVRAAGAFQQKPGCPPDSLDALGRERLAHVCRGECYNPSDARKVIDRIEIVRIRPRSTPDEPMRTLIDDPWRVFECPDDPTGCSAELEDPDFPAGARDVVYYARAIEKPTPTVNGGSLRCERDADGDCLSVKPCYGDYRTDYNDDCLVDTAERAWSSPIFVDHAGG